MNTTLTTDTDDDPDANSRRLLTNKVNTSQIIHKPTTPQRKPINSTYYPPENNISTFTSGSILSKSSLNMTNVTPLNGSLINNSQITKPSHTIPSSSSEYENLSNNTLNDILTNYPNHVPKSGNNLLQYAKPRLAPQQPPNLPPPPVPLNKQQNTTDDSDSVMSCQLISSSNLLLNRDTLKDAKFMPQHLRHHNDTDSESGMSCQLITSSNLLLNRNTVKDAKQISNLPPQLITQFKQQKPLPTSYKNLQQSHNNDTDSDSVMSCQLITSSSLLLNRNTVKEAQNVKPSPVLNSYHNSNSAKTLPPLNPRHFLTNQPKTNESTTQTQSSTSNNDMVSKCQDSDASKPPPMETAI